MPEVILLLCPKCKSYCPKDAEECDCGYNFQLGKMRSIANPEDNATVQKAKDPEALNAYMVNDQWLQKSLRGSFIVLYILGGLNLLIGLLLFLVPVASAVLGAVGLISCILGAFAIITGVLVQRRASPAFVILIVYTSIYGLDTLITVFNSLVSCSGGSVIGLGIRIFFVVLLIKGCCTLWEIRKETKRYNLHQQLNAPR